MRVRVTVAGQKIVRNLRVSLFSSILRQEVGFFDRTRTGELINRLSADSTLVGRSVTDNLSDGLRAVAQAAAGVSMMVSTHTHTHQCAHHRCTHQQPSLLSRSEVNGGNLVHMKDSSGSVIGCRNIIFWLYSVVMSGLEQGSQAFFPPGVSYLWHLIVFSAVAKHSYLS